MGPTPNKELDRRGTPKCAFPKEEQTRRDVICASDFTSSSLIPSTSGKSVRKKGILYSIRHNQSRVFKRRRNIVHAVGRSRALTLRFPQFSHHAIALAAHIYKRPVSANTSKIIKTTPPIPIPP
jgi:hypothetical protein